MTNEAKMMDLEWNGLHCTCGAGAFKDEDHKTGCTVTVIEKLERQRDELAAALRNLLDICEPAMPKGEAKTAWDEARAALAKVPA